MSESGHTCNEVICRGVSCPSVNFISGGGQIGVLGESMHRDEAKLYRHIDIGSGSVSRKRTIPEEEI